MHFNNWNNVIGQERVKEILRSAIRNNRLAHAYLLWGGEGIGKDAIAIEFARVLLCRNQSDTACGECSSCHKINALQHPNVKFIFPLPGGDSKKDDDETGGLENETIEEIKRQFGEKAANPYYKISIPKAQYIRITSIRQIKKESAMTSAEYGKKIFIIFDSDMMNEAAANSLLKVLEEPLPDTHFILATSRKDQVKQTILSRCQLIQCSSLSDDEICSALIERENLTEQQAMFLTRLANGSYSRALELHSEELNQFRSDAVAMLRIILGSSPVKLTDELEDYFSTANRQQTEQLLLMLLVFFRDALILKERGIDAVMNLDQQNDIQSFVEKFGAKDLSACQLAVERALGLLRRNVYLPLVMLSLAVNLKRNLTNAK